MKLSGIYLPIITPFKNGQLDEGSYKKLLRHYLTTNIDGLIPLGTTGESPTVDPNEIDRLLYLTQEEVPQALPVYFGFSGNNTRHMLQAIRRYEDKGLTGLLCATPYYNRPSQEGLYEHFHALSESTDLKIILYNIPYRTGVNMENDTIHKLAEHKNIIGLKDASGNMTQTTLLLQNKPKDFSVLTGEDLHLLSSLALGADGGILASAHLNTNAYATLYRAIVNNDLGRARTIWQKIAPIIPSLFKEPNPGPIKYLLSKEGLIDSSEVRLPLTQISPALKAELDGYSVIF